MFGELDKNTKQFPVRKLNEISSYWNGLTYKPADAVKDGTGTLVLRSSNIQNGALAFEDNVYVNCEIKEKLFVQDNDILMCSRNGSAALVGKTALIKGLVEPTTFGAFMMIIRSEYYSYLRTYFETPFFRSQISTGTSTINQITGKMLNDISLPVPDMDTVRKFESFVHQSDKSKFVRFKSQFIEMFGEDGEKGNCVTKTLQELIDMKWITYHLDGNHGGDYPRADEFVEAGIPYISANCIVGDRIDMKLAKYVTAERAKRFRKGIAENGDVLFAHNATVGPVAILETEEPTVILGTSLTSYRCNSNHILAEYLMAYMKNPLFVQQYERNMQQSTRKQVPITTQRKYSFIIPSMDEQKEFAHFVKQSDKSKLKEEDHKSGMHEL